MHILGLHIIDVSIIIVYLLGMLWIGKLISNKVQNQDDFYISGRKLGKMFQFFLNFGTMTDANSAASVSGVVYRDGVSAVWIAMQTLFMTPFYWFFNKWFRRVRLLTMGDLFVDRFNSHSLAVAYAVFSIFASVFSIGFGFFVSYKTTEAMMVKPESQYTAQEAQKVADYREYVELQSTYQLGELAEQDRERYEVLRRLHQAGELNSYISYINPLVFYAIYGGLIGCYIIMGGFTAAAVTDAFQAILIIVFSFMIIPVGLFRLGGFSGLHSSVPDYLFRLFGDGALSEYAWHSIFALLLVSTIAYLARTHQMACAGSAKTEFAAQIGVVSGGFAKRIIIIFWCLAGLIAYGITGGDISDPDLTWGILTKTLLTPGLIGLMLAGMLAANMSSLDAGAVCISALFTRNLYMPMFPNKTERHYVLISRVFIAVFLLLGVGFALTITGIMSMLQFLIVIYVVFGAPVFLMFVWRRLTAKAVMIEVILGFMGFVMIPWLVPAMPAISSLESLTIQTNKLTHTISVRAKQEDLDDGLAAEIGQQIDKQYNIEPRSCFFEKLVHIDPYDDSSPVRGTGRFYPEIYLVSKLGVNVQNMTPPQLMTTRLLFNGLFPFLVLFVVSSFTKPTDKELLDKFYVKMKTKVQPTPELDVVELEKSYENTKRFDNMKLLPNSNWEFLKWGKVDVIGFSLCWVAVAVILGIFWFVLNIGR